MFFKLPEKIYKIVFYSKPQKNKDSFKQIVYKNNSLNLMSDKYRLKIKVKTKSNKI